ncbi:MAG TPA: hypothetical protein VKR27_02455, partial [Acidimicrobiales bacterium]|nr:hypothetical protein [Acidimicrobiales bacterium]
MRRDTSAPAARRTAAPRAVSLFAPFTSRITLSVAALACCSWVVVAVRSRPGSDARRLLVDVGIALLLVCVIGAVGTWRGAPTGTPALGESPPAKTRGDDPFAETLEIDSAERSYWASATFRAVSAIGLVGEQRDVPDVAVIRVGMARIELLLNAPTSVAPPPFQSSAGGLVWTLDPFVGRDALLDLGKGVPLAADTDSVPLVEIGSDEDGTYFARAGTIAKVRLADDEFGELGDEFPSFGAGDTAATSDAVFGARLVAVERGDRLVLEPFGIVLSASAESP